MPSMDLSELIGLDFDYVPDATHFLQLEEPEKCVKLTLNFLEGRDLI